MLSISGKDVKNVGSVHWAMTETAILDFRRTLWALWLGAAIAGMLEHTSVVLAQMLSQPTTINSCSSMVRPP